MSKPIQDHLTVRPEADTHKDVLNARTDRKTNGRKRHENKTRRDTKWFDKWN